MAAPGGLNQLFTNPQSGDTQIPAEWFQNMANAVSRLAASTGQDVLINGAGVFTRSKRNTVREHLAKLNAQLSAGGSVECTIWDARGGTLASTGRTVTAHDWFLDSGETLESGAKVTLRENRDDGRLYVWNANDCAGA